MILRGSHHVLQVIDYCTLPVGNPVAEGRRALIRNMWTERIQGAKRNVEVNNNISKVFSTLSISIAIVKLYSVDSFSVSNTMKL